MTNTLRTTAIYCELERRARAHDIIAEELLSHITIALPKISRALSDIRVYFRHFTDHALTHSIRIIKNYELMIDQSQYTGEQALSSVDLFLLIGSALIHDIGMVIRESEIESLISEDGFSSHLEEWRAKAELHAPSDWHWCRRGIPRMAVADYVRKRHQRRSLTMVLDSDQSVFQASDLGHDLVNWLGQIAAGHGMDYNDISDPARFPTRTTVGLASGLTQECSPRFTALCLRLGDLLDIGTARACPLLRNFSEPLPTLSMHHWNQYNSIRKDRDHVNTIKISGSSPNQDAERLLRDWCNWLKTEGMRSVTLQNREQPCYRIALGRIEYEVEPQKDPSGRPLYEFMNLKFNLDERVIFERLFGKSLYGRPELALRELIQNAVDAQRTKLAYELSILSEWQTNDQKSRRSQLAQSLIANCQNMPISVVVEERASSDKNKELWLTITDHGIGMTRNVLEHYFLKVGRSRWGEDPTITKLGIGSYAIGTFGVGVLSALMIADRIVVTTKSCLPNEKGIRATIYGWQGYLGTEEVVDIPTGTSISLRMLDRQYRDFGQLVSRLRHLVPNLDFDLIVKSNIDASERTIVPLLAAVSSRNQSRGTTGEKRIPRVLIDSDGSTVTLSQPHPIRDGVILCQDGINIDQVTYPGGRGPEETILRNYNVFIDLRGASRIQLELSRNLPEEGYQLFWSKFVPKIWDSIAAAFPGEYLLNRALADLVDYELLSAAPHPLRFLKPGAGLLRSLPRPTEHPKIGILNPGSENMAAKEILAAGMLTWLTPGLDLHYTTSFGHIPDMDMPASPRYWSKVIRPNLLNKPDQNEDIEEEISEDYVDYYTEDSGQKIYFTQRLDQEWKELLKRYPFIIPTNRKDSMIILTAQETKDAIPITRLIGFQVNENWISLLEPSHGQHHLVPVPIEGELKEYSLRSGINLAGYYAALMWLNFRTGPSEWGVFQEDEIGSKLDAIGSLLEEVVGDGILMDESETEEEETEDLAINNDTPYSSYAEAIVDEFHKVVDQLKDNSATRALDSYVPPWEKKEWRTVRIRRPKRI